MKSLKDCEWEVEILRAERLWGRDDLFFGARCKVPGIRFVKVFGRYCKEEHTVKHNWELFAKRNGIKKWRYEEERR